MASCGFGASRRTMPIFFCAPESIESEIDGCIDFALAVLKTFGFEKYTVDLSTWDPDKRSDYSGEAEDWKRAQGALETVLKRRGIDFRLIPGEAAFYGPKIDFKLIDAIGRSWQLTTIQFDFNLPEKFGLEYVAEDGQRRRPFMVHRALLGSLERFFGVLIEHYAGAFPLWLAPEQVRVLPIGEKQLDAAVALVATLQAAGFRVRVDRSADKIGAKIREAQVEKIPYMFVLGGREVEQGTVSVRSRTAGDLGAMSVDAVTQRLNEEIAARR